MKNQFIDKYIENAVSDLMGKNDSTHLSLCVCVSELVGASLQNHIHECDL